MNLGEARQILEADPVSGSYDPAVECEAGCGSDLLSDVLAFAHAGTLLLTGLINPQVVVTAEMVGIVAIVFVRGKTPPPETVRSAEERGIPLLSTRYTMFEGCGLLFSSGLEGCDRWIARRVG